MSQNGILPAVEISNLLNNAIDLIDEWDYEKHERITLECFMFMVLYNYKGFLSSHLINKDIFKGMLDVLVNRGYVFFEFGENGREFYKMVFKELGE